MKDCGLCSLCCKLIEVPNLAKAGEWCPHCCPGTVGGGCMIHNDRPEYCKGFHCFWRAESWPDEYRPDRSKVIFEALPGVKTILISVDPDKPDAWKKKSILAVIEKLRKKGRPLVLKTQNDSEMFIPSGWTKQSILKEIKQVMDWKEKMNGGSVLYN
jgi:hypothetical protein